MSYILGPVLDQYKKPSTSNTTSNKYRRRRDSDSSMIHSSYNNSNNSNNSSDSNEEEEEEEDEEMSSVPSVGFEQPSTVDTTTADSIDATTRWVYILYVYNRHMLFVRILYMLCI